MKRIIICCCGAAYQGRREKIKQLEQQGEIRVVGVTDKKLVPGVTFDGWPVIPREKIGEYSFDSIVVFSYHSEREIKEELIEQGVESRVIEFDLPFRSIEGSSNGISILCNNCWGGFCANSLGIEFCSPTKNLWIPETSFIVFLRHLRYYLSLDPVMGEWIETVGRDDLTRYPKLMVGDIPIYCNHDKDPDEAIAKWQTRKQKVNFKNLVSVFTLTIPALEKEFYQVEEIEKKYCLVPWESSYPHSVFIPDRKDGKWIETVVFTGKRDHGLDLNAMMRGADNFVNKDLLFKAAGIQLGNCR